MTRFNAIRLKQQGVALITALLVVSLATIMTVTLMSQQYIDIRRTGNMLQSDQAHLDAIAAETFVGQLLANFRSSGESTFDDPSIFSMALMQLSGDMSDEVRIISVQADYPESRFNVNNLIDQNNKVNTQQQDVYRRLLSSVIVDVGGNEGQVDSLVSSLLDWLDSDEESRLDGAEDSVYESKDLPYKAANRQLASITELRLIEGYTAELLEGIPANEEEEIEKVEGLFAYLSALPDHRSAININTLADTKIMMALNSKLDISMVDDLFDAKPFEKVLDFTSHESLTVNDASLEEGEKKLTTEMGGYASNLSVQSQYFIIKSHVAVGRTVVSLNSLVYIAKNGDDFEVISRAIGTDRI